MIPRLEGLTLPTESRGQVLPVLLGDLWRDVRGIPLQVGQAAQLGIPCGLDELDSVTTLALTGADLQEVLAIIPRPWIAQIDNEWFHYTGVTINPPTLTGVTRAYAGTVAADHSENATVYFIEPKPLYAFAANWPGLRYPDDAVVRVRIDGISPVPFYTVRCQDTRPLDGWRILTIQFDLTRYFNQRSGANRTAIVIAGGGPTPEEAALWTLGVHPISGGSVNFSSLGATTGGKMRLGDVPLPARAPIAARQTAPQTPVTPRTTPSGTQAVRVFPPTLGNVSADIKGQLDTVEGRFTSVPSGPIRVPAHQARCVLENGYGETTSERFHAPSWTDAADRQSERGWTWRVKWEGQRLREFLDAAGYCGQSDIFIDDDGRWRNVFRDPQAPVVKTITTTERIGDLQLQWTAVSDLGTRLQVTWGQGLQGGAFTLTSDAMVERFGLLTKTLDLPFVASEAMARIIARYWLGQRDHPRLTGPLVAPYALLGLTRTDRVWVDDPILETYGQRRVPLEVRGTTDRGEERTLTLIEADPLALQVRAVGLIRQAATLDIIGAGILSGDAPDLVKVWDAMPGIEW